jgi:cell shape-determining protein MreC
MILYGLFIIVIFFLMRRKEGFQKKEPFEETAEDPIIRIDNTVQKLNERLSKIEKDISDFSNE